MVTGQLSRSGDDFGGWAFHAVCLGLVFCAVAGLSFHGIANQSLWLDETISVEVARLNWHDTLRLMYTREPNMVLYQVLLHYWVKLGSSEFLLRLPSALCAIAAILPVYGIGERLWGRNAGLSASVLLGVNAFFIKYAQEGRSYALLVLLTASASYLFLKAVDAPSRSRWAAYIAVGALSVYAHFFAVWVIAAHAVSAVLFSHGHARRRDVLIGVAAVALLVSPLIIPIHLAGARIGWLSKPNWSALVDLSSQLTGFGGIALVRAYAVVCGVAVVTAGAKWITTRRVPWGQAFVMTWLVLPVLGTYLFSLVVTPILVSRYLIVVLPALALTAAAGAHSLRPRWAAPLAVLLLVWLSTRGLTLFYSDQGPFVKEDWRGAITYVLDNTRAGDGIVFYQPFLYGPFDYYRSLRQGPASVPEITQRLPTWSGIDPGQFTRDQSRQAPYSRLWRVLSYDFPPVPTGPNGTSWLPPGLPGQYCLASVKSFVFVRIALYERCP